MTWFRVDDTLAGHPKARLAGLPAMGLWVVAGAYAGQQLTDGFVPDWYVASWPSGRRHAEGLVKAGLWLHTERDGVKGYCFHEWSDRQPSREKVEADRAGKAERQQRWRDSHNASHNASTSPSRNQRGDTAPTRPDPNTPLPPATNAPPSIDRSSAEADGDFDTFWIRYPRRADQAKARAAWRRATSDTPAETILIALDQQLDQLRDVEPRFVPKADTWLRNQRWLDEPPEDTDPWGHMPVINPRPPNWRELLEQQPQTGPTWTTPPPEPRPPSRMPDHVRNAIKPTERTQP